MIILENQMKSHTPKQIAQMAHLAGRFTNDGKYVVKKMQLVWYRVRRMLDLKGGDVLPDYREFTQMICEKYGGKYEHVFDVVFPCLRDTSTYRPPKDETLTEYISYQRDNVPMKGGKMGKRFRERITTLIKIWCEEYVPKEVIESKGFQSMLLWWEEKLLEHWKTKIAQLNDLSLVIDKDFHYIYNSENYKQCITSCMSDKDNWKFFRSCPDAYAASVRDYYGKIVARCIAWDKVHYGDNMSREPFKYIDRIYATHEKYAHILTKALDEQGYTMSYKMDINKMKMGDRFVEVNAKSGGYCSWMDTFIYFDERQQRSFTQSHRGCKNLQITENQIP